jgi:hypothetical protein
MPIPSHYKRELQERKHRHEMALREKVNKPKHPKDWNITHPDACTGCKEIIALGKELKDVNSTYPLVVITNVELLLENSSELATHGIQLHKLEDDAWLRRHCTMKEQNKNHFQKLMIFGMTEFDKLIWLDADVHVKKNVDHLFEEGDNEIITSQADDFDCTGQLHVTSHGFCSGVMRFKPSKETLQGLMRQQAKMDQCWGDQAIIADYFKSENKRLGKKFHHFNKTDVQFGKCDRKSTKKGKRPDLGASLVHESGQLRGWKDGVNPNDGNQGWPQWR